MKSMKDSVEVRLDTKSSDGFKGSLKSAPNSSAIFFASFLEGASAGLLADATREPGADLGPRNEIRAKSQHVEYVTHWRRTLDKSISYRIVVNVKYHPSIYEGCRISCKENKDRPQFKIHYMSCLDPNRLQ